MRVTTSLSRSSVVGQFFRFGLVGAFGFLIDTATVYALRGPLGLYGAGLAAYVTAASANWALNRSWTFRGRGGGAAAHRQWARFLLANLAGFVLNRGTYAALVTAAPLCAAQPVLAVAAGAVAGMGVNFTLCRRLVFADRRHGRPQHDGTAPTLPYSVERLGGMSARPATRPSSPGQEHGPPGPPDGSRGQTEAAV